MKEKLIANLNPYELLFSTCQLIAKKQKIKLQKKYIKFEDSDLDTFLQQVANASNVRIRLIALQDEWWEKDGGSLLVFYKNQPSALLPRKGGGYTMVCLAYGLQTKVNASIAEEISKQAYYFYPSFPAKALTLSTLWKFIRRQVNAELWPCLIFEVLRSFFILLIPFALGLLIKATHTGNSFLLYLAIIFVFLDISFICLLKYILTNKTIRLHFKMEAVWTPALWDRILKFPTAFFRRHSVSQLTFHANMAAEIPQILYKILLEIFSNATLLIFSIVCLFYLNSKLALFVIFWALILGLVIFFLHYFQSQRFRQWYHRFSHLMDFTFEILSGILKIRVANAEGRLFNKWVFYLTKRTESESQAQISQNYLDIFMSIMVFFSVLTLFSVLAFSHVKMGLTLWVIFFGVFLIFMVTLRNLNQILDEILQIINGWEHSKNLFNLPIEVSTGSFETIDLKGKIELNNIVFGYQPAENYLFKNLSIKISPGECVAIVGPSGSGKSSLFRLMLGLEKPQDGEIYYDDINIKNLKLNSMRRHIGSVMQNSALMPGTILSNIIGNNTQLSRRDAWDIAEKVGLAHFIKLLPMQMDTIISEGPITLSGGEAQRLILARAIAQNPKILFLDEATSALDNTTQAVVQHYLKELKATQVIAAHRLSTIEYADKIYVLDKGYIVQTGNFKSLMSEPGLFANLALRQLK